MIQLDESPDRNEDDIIFEDFARLRVQQANGHTNGTDPEGIFSGSGTPSSSTRYGTNGSVMLDGNFI